MRIIMLAALLITTAAYADEVPLRMVYSRSTEFGAMPVEICHRVDDALAVLKQPKPWGAAKWGDCEVARHVAAYMARQQPYLNKGVITLVDADGHVFYSETGRWVYAY